MSGNNERPKVEMNFPEESRFGLRKPKGNWSWFVISLWSFNILFYTMNLDLYGLWAIPLYALAIFCISIEIVEKQKRGPSRGLEPEEWMNSRDYRNREIDSFYELSTEKFEKYLNNYKDC